MSDMDRFAAEFRALKGRPFILETDVVTAWIIIGQVQLALRHPKNTGPTAEIARRAIEHMIQVVAPEGTVLRDVAEKGWNSDYDE